MVIDEVEEERERQSRMEKAIVEPSYLKSVESRKEKDVHYYERYCKSVESATVKLWEILLLSLRVMRSGKLLFMQIYIVVSCGSSYGRILVYIGD